jgi:hypothetical protein
MDVNILRPPATAYALGYAASVSPRLFGFLKTVRRKDISSEEKLRILAVILRTSTELHRFPTAAAAIIAGATTIPSLLILGLRWLLRLLNKDLKVLGNQVFVKRLRLVCSFVCAWLAFSLLNRDRNWARKRARSMGAAEVDITNPDAPNQHHLPPPGYHPRYAGKTIDFTLFAAVRALDVLVIAAWVRSRSNRWHPEKQVPRLASLAKQIADPWIFASSAAVIMFAWFYAPQRLPRAYNRWISTAADIDPRLIQALRLCRQGDFVYGQDTGQAPLLTSLCNELGLPPEWGDPAKTIPIPCELYHCGAGKSCEIHATKRFLNAWKFSMELYLPLQLLTKLRHPSTKAYATAVLDASRSSSFLAGFVTLFYYSVCLARTRIGPKLISPKTVTPQMWDSGLCVLAGCMACGWSIMLEKVGRRQEIAFFVAPRALSTLMPRVYDKRHQRREQVAFALSVAIVINAAQSSHTNLVRGVLGRILKTALAT